MKPLVVITAGDPAGIGPEVTVKALKKIRADSAKILVIGPKKLLADELPEVDIDSERGGMRPKGNCSFYDPCPDVDFNPGKLNKVSGNASMRYVVSALNIVNENKGARLVTGPVSKFAIMEAGIQFTGHTEYLARRCGVRHFCQTFVTPDDRKFLISSFVTTHVPYKRVTVGISKEEVASVTMLTHDFAKILLKKAQPKIGVCGLNPHAGESGKMGTEERTKISPGIMLAIADQVAAVGPVAGDSAFREMRRGKYDAIVYMFHDQGLSSVKAFSDSSVNVTLGLPFLRTCPDHGVAADIAGKGSAKAESMIEAIKLAISYGSDGQSLF